MGECMMGFKGLRMRKKVDSDNPTNDLDAHHGLARRLTVIDLVGIGVGSTLGAGVYILIGNVAREYTGPALAVAFLIAGIAAALSAFCYAELSCRCPSAGSAYHYSYICIGEGVAWIIGWGLILEYAIGGSVVARGVTPNLALYFGGEDNLPVFLARHTIFGIVVDPSAAVLVIIATILLCCGIKESSMAQTIVTAINVCALLFVILTGGYLASKNGWVGYELSNGYFPFGVNGLLAGSATIFFSYIGFDSVTATAEEVKNPKKSLPWGIGITLSLSCALYMLLSFVVVGLVPYYKLDEDTPISSAFSVYGMNWAAYIVTTGAVMALLATLMGSLLPQSRILMAMARDGLLPSFFADVNKYTHVPVKGTIATGVLAAALAFFMDVSTLAGMVSVGTLLAFTAVAVSLLIVRYIPPYEVPNQSFAEESSAVDGDHQNLSQIDEHIVKGLDDSELLLEKREAGYERPRFQESCLDKPRWQRRRKSAGWFIRIVCIGILIIASTASVESISSLARIALCSLGGVIFLGALAGLAYIGQDDAANQFGRKGGFICPFVPYLPAACALINTYLLINIGIGTMIRVSVWLVIGALVYLLYGRTHSSLSGI